MFAPSLIGLVDAFFDSVRSTMSSPVTVPHPRVTFFQTRSSRQLPCLHRTSTNGYIQYLAMMLWTGQLMSSWTSRERASHDDSIEEDATKTVTVLLSNDTVTEHAVSTIIHDRPSTRYCFHTTVKQKKRGWPLKSCSTAVQMGDVTRPQPARVHLRRCRQNAQQSSERSDINREGTTAYSQIYRGEGASITGSLVTFRGQKKTAHAQKQIYRYKGCRIDAETRAGLVRRRDYHRHEACTTEENEHNKTRTRSTWKATTDGVVRAPSVFSITRGARPSMIATHEFVVPRSIPMMSPAPPPLAALSLRLSTGATAAACGPLAPFALASNGDGEILLVPHLTLANCRCVVR